MLLQFLPVSAEAARGITCSTVLCASIYLGGRFAFDLPTIQTNNTSGITSPPVTLHTLAATVGGMRFGPKIGTGGAVLHMCLWLYIHNGVRPSIGYVFGMIPCAGIAGWLLPQQQEELKSEKEGLSSFRPPPFFTTFTIAVISQSVTLLCGVFFLYVRKLFYKNREIESKGNTSNVQQVSFQNIFIVGALPYVPGLFVKSILSWIFLSIIDHIF
mmetsp:Transcript_26563/g.37422  ORF Transcript_26563/g.37422 Transcript_26563/m.37422 type:complete len:214 (+) Transcript_26563:214-855(+)